HGEGVEDIGWIKPDGREMEEADWQQGFVKTLGVFLNGEAIPNLDARGERVRDSSFYLLFNAHDQPVPFQLPERADWGDRWEKVLDTRDPLPEAPGEIVPAGARIELEGRSLVVLCRSGRNGRA
ncbi:MAG TPA: glycogen debranching enzyme, partial [Thermoanaerobaculia bacterium]|nr:glycogen debranching enzyme [Thermoanaerobaculia bacterium]